MKLNALKLLYFSFRKIRTAVDEFYVRQNFSVFDPHVGDTLCQIRAAMFLHFYKNNNSNNYQKGNIELKKIYEILAKIRAAINIFENKMEQNKSNYFSELDAKEELISFLKKWGLDFKLSTEIHALFISLLLTQFRIMNSEGMAQELDYLAFSRAATISKNAAKNLLDFYQVRLSVLSTNFVLSLVDKLPDYLREKKSLLHICQRDSNKRAVLPCYEVTKIILAYLAVNQYPILLRIQEQDFFFHFCKEKNDFILTDNNVFFNKSKLHYIIVGRLKNDINFNKNREGFLISLSKFGFQRTILLNMILHPQYSSTLLSSFNENPYKNFVDTSVAVEDKKELLSLEADFLSMRNQALELVDTASEILPFTIQHIFSDRFDTQSDKSHNMDKKDVLLEFYHELPNTFDDVKNNLFFKKIPNPCNLC